MIEARRGDEEISIRTRFARYEVTEEDGTVYLEAPGLLQEIDKGEFPAGADLLAIACYMVAQLETKLIGD